MKEFIISVSVVMLLASIFNSVAIWMGLMPNLPPYPFAAGIGEIKKASPTFGCKREDFCYPEIHFTNGNRPITFITDITETGSDRGAEFPLGANN
ncbi:MAG: hypothetical protein K2X27_04005 [Candidatus Obscuribacterales bacterium]|nr:hypothetical protein [Candidatus Obscuribacterales bacterium]